METKAPGASTGSESNEDPVVLFFTIVSSFGDTYAKCREDIITWDIEAEKKIKMEKQKIERKEQKQCIEVKAHQLLSGKMGAAALNEKNVFEKFSAIQEQNPTAIIAAFQTTDDDDAKSDSSDVADIPASDDQESKKLDAEKLFDSDED